MLMMLCSSFSDSNTRGVTIFTTKSVRGYLVLRGLEIYNTQIVGVYINMYKYGRF
jgi:hypothetical protein